MSKLMKAAMAATEDLHEDLTGVEPEEADITEEALAITVRSDEVESGLNEADEFNHNAEDLNTLGNLMNVRSQATGGLTPTEAEVIQCATESLYRRLGIKKPKTMAAEGFSQAANIKLAVESIGETLKKAWHAIIEFIKRMVGMVKEFFIGLFDAVKRIENRAQKLKSKAEALATAGAQPAGQRMKPRNYWRDLATSRGPLGMGWPETSQDVRKAIVEANSAFLECADNTVELLQKAGKSLQEVSRGSKSVDEARIDLNFLMKYRFKLAAKGDAYEYALGKDMPGTRNVRIMFPEGDKGNQHAAFMNIGLFGGITVSTKSTFETMEAIGYRFNLKADATIAIATAHEAAGICDAVLGLARTIEDSKKFSQEVLSEMNHAIGMAQNASQHFDDRFKGSSASLRKALLAYGKVGALVMTKLGAISVSVAGGGLSYVRHSLSHNHVQ